MNSIVRRDRLALNAALALPNSHAQPTWPSKPIRFVVAVRPGQGLQADHAVGDTPAEFARLIAAEQARCKPVIARAKIKPD